MQDAVFVREAVGSFFSLRWGRCLGSFVFCGGGGADKQVGKTLNLTSVEVLGSHRRQVHLSPPTDGTRFRGSFFFANLRLFVRSVKPGFWEGNIPGSGSAPHLLWVGGWGGFTFFRSGGFRRAGVWATGWGWGWGWGSGVYI